MTDRDWGIRPHPSQVRYRLYTDGGTVSAQALDENGVLLRHESGAINYHANPSLIGITWAYALVDSEDETLVRQGSGHLCVPIIVDDRHVPAQSDVAEFYAGMRGLEAVPHPQLNVEYLTDSHLTIRRMFRGAATATLPRLWVQRAARARARCGQIYPTPLNGHPTRAQLAGGIGHSGEVCSRWNVLTDKACGEQKDHAWTRYIDWLVSLEGLGDTAQRTAKRVIIPAYLEPYLEEARARNAGI